VLQKCAKNAQVQNNPTFKWGTCHNGTYVILSKINCYPKSRKPKKHPNQNWYNLWAIVSLLEGDGIPWPSCTTLMQPLHQWHVVV
jgi:hypothetical protein